MSIKVEEMLRPGGLVPPVQKRQDVLRRPAAPTPSPADGPDETSLSELREGPLDGAPVFPELPADRLDARKRRVAIVVLMVCQNE